MPELLPVWAAQDQGFDTKNGLKLSIINAEGGSKGLLALVAGSFQAMWFTEGKGSPHRLRPSH